MEHVPSQTSINRAGRGQALGCPCVLNRGWGATERRCHLSTDLKWRGCQRDRERRSGRAGETQRSWSHGTQPSEGGAQVRAGRVFGDGCAI